LRDVLPHHSELFCKLFARPHYGQTGRYVIREVLRVHNRGSQKIKDPVQVLNKFERESNNWPEKSTGALMRTAGS
jgi:hypothetical protein